jgi:CDGSH-type Zn-finger protein
VLLRDTRVALCRCGRSRKRPFCDNSHQTAAFRDDGAVRWEAGVQETGVEGPRLRVQAEADGALVLTGPFAIASADGATMLAGSHARLCRCGQSACKPFCDESHVRTGFRSA